MNEGASPQHSRSSRGANKRVLVVGTGSIGQRHARNLVALGVSVTVADVDEERLSGLDDTLLLTGTPGEQFPDGYDGIVIATPTTLHASQATAALAASPFVFVEKPLAWTLSEGVALVEEGGDRLMVGFNLRHHEPLQRVAELVHTGKAGQPLSYRFWFGHWLPDWRPGIDYRTNYSARADLGGGVLFDAIHEIDLAVWMVDRPMTTRSALVDRLGPLEIDVEDTVRAVLVTDTGVPVSIDLDYLSRNYRRGVEVIGDAATVSYDWSTQALEIKGPDGATIEHFDTPVSASYEREMDQFVDVMSGRCRPAVDGPTGLLSLQLASEIRELGCR